MVEVTLYNAAGEVVRELFEGRASTGISTIELSSTTVVGGQSPLTLSFNALLQGVGGSLVWVADNDSGQAVSSGTYYVSIKTSDQFGAESTVSREIAVIAAPGAGGGLDVFNAAGERVAQFDLSRFADPIVDFRVDTPTFSPVTAPGLSGTAGAGSKVEGGIVSGSGLLIHLLDTKGATHTIEWNGRNDQGVAVASGGYSLILNHVDPVDGSKHKKAGSVQLLQNGLELDSARLLVGPNPARDFVKAFYAVQGSAAVRFAQARLYNAAGELIATTVDDAGQGWLSFDVRPMSSGVYIVSTVIQLSNGRIVRLSQKVAVLH
jgi:hypothetical protein